MLVQISITDYHATLRPLYRTTRLSWWVVYIGQLHIEQFYMEPGFKSNRENLILEQEGRLLTYKMAMLNSKPWLLKLPGQEQKSSCVVAPNCK